MRLRFIKFLGVFLLFTIASLPPYSFAAILANGKINGTVKDRAGNRLAGVKVSAANKNSARSSPAPVRSNQDGYYRFPSVEPGRYDLTYRKKGFKRAYLNDVEVTANRETQIDPDVILEPRGTGSAGGTVADTTGKALEGVEVLATDAEEGDVFTARTNSQGSYLFTIPEGTYRLTASAQGYLPAAEGVEVEAGKSKQVNLVLTPKPSPMREAMLVRPARPGIANPAEFQPAGLLQLELGYNRGFGSEDGYTEQTVPLTLRYAATDSLLLETSLDIVRSVTPAPLQESRTGVGDVRLGVQLVVVRGEPIRPALALAYEIKFPTGDERKGFSTGRIDHKFTILISQKTGFMNVDINGGAIAVGRQGGSGSVIGGFGAASIRQEFKKDFGLISEVSWQTKDYIQRRGLYGLGALTYRINPSIVLDVGARFNLSSDIPRLSIFTGLAVAVGDFFK